MNTHLIHPISTKKELRGLYEAPPRSLLLTCICSSKFLRSDLFYWLFHAVGQDPLIADTVGEILNINF